MNFEVPKLKVLNLSHTLVDDITLYAISKNCRGILQLLLKNCYHITKKGVKHMVESCTRLRELNLKYCYVDANAIASMILSRPSLRKIIAPYLYRLSDGERELLSHHRCLVY
jgi:F-box and leucine-rich repeat protein 2/20